MKTYLIRAGVSAFALALFIGSLPVPVHAQGADILSGVLARATSAGSYGRISSSLSRKIRALDEDEVKEFPIPVVTGVAVKNLTKNFGDPRDGGSRTHEGLDIMAAKGTYIASPTDAVVTHTGTGSSAGKFVYTANPGGERFVYMHLESTAVRSGDVLKPGDLIGTVGNTGNASGGAPHLHFEVRDGRKATDPFPRLTREFTVKERIVAFEDAVKEADDRDEEAEAIVRAHRALLLAAQASGEELSDELSDALGPSSLPTGTILAGTPSYARDLTLGSTGADVSALQAFLIAENRGEGARALTEAGATGYFGPVTMRALAEYQAALGIMPSSGYFGPVTRARILSVI